MTTPETLLACTGCGSAAPPLDSAEFGDWCGGGLDEAEQPVPAGLLLCPACRASEAPHNELGGG
jgi:hypothetical protein